MATLRIKELCKEQGITISTLADRVGMTRVSIGNMVAGRQSPPLSTLEAIANALGVEVVDLLSTSGTKVNCPHCGKPITIHLG